VHTGFWWGNLRERDHLNDQGVDETIILRLIFKKLDGGMNWTDLAKDRGRRQALVNAVMHFQMRSYLASPEEPYSMRLLNLYIVYPINININWLHKCV
jgi:hypothetical protein